MSQDPDWDQKFADEITAHDAQLKKRGANIWVGGEPTFTDRFSAAAEWNTGASGDEKAKRGLQGVAEVAKRHPGAVILRTLGRQYPEDDLPRFSVGVYARRDGEAIWGGPPDPCVTPPADDPTNVNAFRHGLASHLSRLGYKTQHHDAVGNVPCRLLFSKTPLDKVSQQSHPLLRRPSVHLEKTPPDGALDELAAEGLFLLCIGCAENDPKSLRLELPSIPDVPQFLQLLAAISKAANETQVPALILGGFSPPIDQSVAFMTLTPDPGVLEINMAPSPDAKSLLGEMRSIYADADTIGLSPLRLHFNGDLADSGGGGHLTFGGPTPEQSPFLLEPRLIGRLVAYFNAHPSLSYAFCEHAGSSSQAPRADEGTREVFEDLRLSLALLEQAREPSPELIWKSVAPFLVDRFGNTHRAEINVEKLWNPYLPGRGQLGLVEFRALRMPPRPERWASLAALFRGLMVMLAEPDCKQQLVDWGPELHDRFALPFFMQQDLTGVFGELDAHGLAPGPLIRAELMKHGHRLQAKLQLPGAEVELRSAIEFWPVVGDLSSQNEPSRLIDPSCRRVELRLRANEAELSEWSLVITGHRVALVKAKDSAGAVGVMGIRYRSFMPNIGIHPLLGATETLELTLCHPRHGCHRIAVHAWRTDGEAYDGLPKDQAAARERRQERTVVSATESIDVASLPGAPESALTPHCIDTRWLGLASGPVST